MVDVVSALRAINCSGLLPERGWGGRVHCVDDDEEPLEQQCCMTISSNELLLHLLHCCLARYARTLYAMCYPRSV
jgi:hypothetical protein